MGFQQQISPTRCSSSLHYAATIWKCNINTNGGLILRQLSNIKGIQRPRFVLCTCEQPYPMANIYKQVNLSLSSETLSIKPATRATLLFIFPHPPTMCRRKRDHSRNFLFGSQSSSTASLSKLSNDPNVHVQKLRSSRSIDHAHNRSSRQSDAMPGQRRGPHNAQRDNGVHAGLSEASVPTQQPKNSRPQPIPFHTLASVVKPCPWNLGTQFCPSELADGNRNPGSSKDVCPRSPRSWNHDAALSFLVTDYTHLAHPQFIISCALEHVNLLQGWLVPGSGTNERQKVLMARGSSGHPHSGEQLRSLLLDGTPNIELSIQYQSGNQISGITSELYNHDANIRKLHSHSQTHSNTNHNSSPAIGTPQNRRTTVQTDEEVDDLRADAGSTQSDSFGQGVHPHPQPDPHAGAGCVSNSKSQHRGYQKYSQHQIHPGSGSHSNRNNNTNPASAEPAHSRSAQFNQEDPASHRRPCCTTVACRCNHCSTPTPTTVPAPGPGPEPHVVPVAIPNPPYGHGVSGW